MKNRKHSNIPIFLPELSCPHQCVFCDQRKISGTLSIPNPEEISKIIERHLSTMNNGREIEIAFFGGSFTGLPLKLQEAYLKAAYIFIENKKAGGIRISTRPDYINIEVLELLKNYNVTAIELGAQSTNDEVLLKSGRGHNYKDIIQACELIRRYDISLGLQMMIGLPGDTIEKSIHTAEDIVKLGATSTRIYPTLVVKDTALEKLFNKKLYQPLTIQEAVNWTKEIVKIFIKNKITILRIGLHPSEELKEGCSLIAGPAHSSFKELVVTNLFNEIITKSINDNKNGDYLISANSRFINYAVGYKKLNKLELEKKGIPHKFIIDNQLNDYEINVSRN
ncbi:MAG: radical SAM protein [Bacteroidetes bacterium]|nr:radical SAM protein [Bacteroidota bacterium]